MKRSPDHDFALQFIVESERNLSLAGLMHDHYGTARQQIVQEFYSRLSISLLAKLNGWMGRYDEPLFEEQWGAFNFFKPEWKDLYSIRLEAYDYGKRMLYGVHRHLLAWSQPVDKQVLAAVRTAFPGATSRKAWNAEVLMTSPAPDWRTASALWRMKTDDGFRAEVEAALIKVAELASTHIDRLVRAFPKSQRKG